MLLYTFGNYEGFKELFGLREHGNGVVSRRNAILLSYYKSRKLMRYMRDHNYRGGVHISNMSGLKSFCLRVFRHEGNRLHAGLYLNNERWGSNEYYTDKYNGLTIDGDANSIRYRRVDNDKVFKMRAGKMYRKLILETPFGRLLPEQVVNWLIEELVASWVGHNKQNQYTLHVDKNFEKIYTRRETTGNFGSCMTDEDQHSFYENAVDASAAYITNADDKIVARAIIFNNVHDYNSDQTFRLCERQYSEEGSDLLKQVLVNKLIEGGYIDGYKRVGADCHSPRSFVAVNGESMSDRDLYIDCNLDYDDTLSYQDTFKWYDMNERKAYNFEERSGLHDLATTTSRLYDNRNWDSYHERHTENDVVTVYVDGIEYECDEEDLEDFVHINGRYHHENNVDRCSRCGDYMITDDGYYSDITEEWYCCESCRDEAEQKYCEDHPDEYVWVDGEAIPADQVQKCPECHELMNPRYHHYHSNLTQEYYCTSSCRNKAEREHIRNHPELGWRICDECGAIVSSVSATQTEDGRNLCSACQSAQSLFSLLNQSKITV